MQAIKNEKFMAPPALKQFSLEGKTAFITGAGSGLGMAVARGFAMAGADLVLVDARFEAVEAVAAELKQAGCKALPVKADVTSAADVQAAVAATLAEYGGIDALVNCAGNHAAHAVGRI